MREVFLETERLVLRRFTADDVDLLAELHGDPEVMRYVTGRATPRERIEREILPMYLRWHERSPHFGYFAAEEKATGEFVGWFHLYPGDDDPPGHVELGYRLRRAAWGKGYAAEGARGLIEKAFAEMGVERVYAQTMAVNVASRRVLEKAGMRFVRHFHADWPVKLEGDEHGDVEYEATPAEGEAP